MEISGDFVLEVWELFSETVPASKRNDLAVRYLSLILKDVDIGDIDEIRGEDENLDFAFEHLGDDDYDDTLDYDDE
jgi:hypothetical protein